MIKLTQVHKVVNQTTVIDIEVLTVAAGEAAVVNGLTGAQLTVFVDLCTGQIQPSAGTIRLAGMDPFAERQRFAQEVGLLPAQNGHYPRLSARNNLTFYCDLYGLSHGRADVILQQVGLQDQARTRADDLSPSLARRLAYGRAILHAPSVLLVVEPFADCDAPSISILARLLQAALVNGCALLFVANDRQRVNPLCQLVVEMENGRVGQQYRPVEREAQTTTPFKIPARLEGKVALVNPFDILYVTADEGRTLLCTDQARIPTHLTLTEVEERLARSGFFRAHRSYLVNLQHITEVIAYTRNSYTLILDGGDGRVEIPLSKGAARELRELMDY